uniref:Large ribosomal subunit protein eL34 n=1 Tax=Panagrellus redivivus TaxID=6233 RepID=A0A7E4W578_PANRE
MVQRITRRTKNPYNTTSNKVRVVKTPGGKNVFQHIHKKAKVPTCGDTGVKLQGVRPIRPHKRTNTPRSNLTVSRIYGGVLSHGAVRQRIIRAFLVEEQKIAAKILKQKDTK